MQVQFPSFVAAPTTTHRSHHRSHHRVNNKRSGFIRRVVRLAVVTCLSCLVFLACPHHTKRRVWCNTLSFVSSHTHTHTTDTYHTKEPHPPPACCRRLPAAAALRIRNNILLLLQYIITLPYVVKHPWERIVVAASFVKSLAVTCGPCRANVAFMRYVRCCCCYDA